LKVLKLIFFFLFILKNSATGQIVTPSLDASVLSLMPASAGWRDETNFNGSFESFAESDLEGNDSTATDVSYMVSSKLLYNLYQESFSSTTTVDKKYSSGFSNLNEKSKNAKTKFNVAMGFGQPLAGNAHRFFVGVSYSSGRIDEEKSTVEINYKCPVAEITYTSNWWPYDTRTYCPKDLELEITEGASNTINIIESGLGLGISYNVWQLLYVSYGVQQTTTNDGEAFISDNKGGGRNYRYLGNTWLDKYYGFSIKNTKPGVAKFRLEMSYVQSASATNVAAASDNATSSAETKEETNNHDRYEIQIRNMEFSPTNLNNWVFYLHLKQTKIIKDFSTSDGIFQNMTNEQISTGFYWSYPGKAGLAIGLRYIDSKRFLNQTSGTSYLSEKVQVSSGKGNRISVDYRF
jgi:hypothetical protein